MKNTFAVEIQGLTKSFKDFKALNTIDLNIKHGEKVVICGPSGSGKSTLLKYICGLHTSKNIILSESSENNIAYLGHKNAFVEEISLRQNFKLNGTNLKDELLKIFGLSKLKNQKYFSLSYGEKRKAALINLFQSQKKIWVIDEPFSGLDSASIDAIKKIIKKHADDGGLIVLANHQEEIDGSKKIHLGGINAS